MKSIKFIVVAIFAALNLNIVAQTTKTYTFDDGVALATDWTVSNNTATVGGKAICEIAAPSKFSAKDGNYLFFGFENKSKISISITSTASYSNITNITFDAVANDNSKPDFTLNIVDDNGTLVKNIYSNYGTKDKFNTGGTNKWGVSNSDISPATTGHVQLVLYASSSGKYAAIDNLKVTSGGGGTTPPEPVAVTGVSLNKTSTTIDVGASETLTATVAPSNATNQNVSWSSNNTAVATVNNGLVTGVTAGTATITVTTEDGSKTATCVVTVTTPSSDPVAVTGVSLNKASTSIKVGATETLTATIAPSNATNKAVTWSSDKTSVATVNNGVITGVAAGTATITVTTEDGNKTATCSVTVTSGPPVPVSGLTTHVPEIYEAKEIAGGYNGTLTVVDGREYEVYYMTRDAESKFCIATTNADKTTGITTLTSGDYSCKANDGWFKFSATGWSSSSDAMGAEFGTMARRLDMDNTCEFTMRFSGFDQFAIVARDKKQDTSSGQTKPGDNQYLEVYINDVLQPRQFNGSPSIRRYDIPTSECVVRVVHYGTNKSSMYGFSLRVAQEPRTRYLKGNDTTQTVLQTTAIKAVTYVTKYNNIPGAETKLEWIDTEATGITLTKVPGPLTDTLLLSGNANCPTGTYTYAVVAYYNGVETSRETGKFKVTSDIKALSATDAVVYQNEEMDQISFQYYALDASAVNLTWTNQVPIGISGQGTTAGKYIIGGTPTVIGTYPYSITVVGADTTIKGTITVKELNYGNNPVLYLYKNDNAFEKDGVFKYLTSQDGGKRNLITRKAKNDGLRPADQYAKYKWILISEDVDADNPEALALARGEGGLPVLSMKSFSYTPGRLDWGEPDNGSLTDEGRFITVWRADHPILKAFNKKQGERIQVLDTVVGKGLMPIAVNYAGTLCLATARTRDINDYFSDGPEETFLHEVPANMHRGQKYICLPIGAEGSNYLSRDGKKLIDEAIKYILGNEATIQLPALAITDFKIGSYKGKIDDAENLITIDVLEKDSNAMKTAQPQIQLASPLTFVTPNSGETVDFSNWHFGVDFIVSDYINKRKYNVIVRLYNPQGIENIEAGTWVNIYDIYGRKVATTNEDLRTMELPHGMYIIVTDDGQTIKIMK